MTQLEKKKGKRKQTPGPCFRPAESEPQEGAGLGYFFAEWAWLPVNGVGSSGALQVREVRGVDLPKARGRGAGPEKAWIFVSPLL